MNFYIGNILELCNRVEILAEAKKQGLILSGHNFIDYENGLLINSAYLISKTRRLLMTCTLEEAIAELINGEPVRS